MMPKYEYECQSCGLAFSRILRMRENLHHECPSCQEQAPRVFEGQVFAFGFQTPQAKEGNSGVHKEDYPTADHAVGRDAARKWAYYDARAKVKEEVRKGGGAAPLSRVDGAGYTEYESLTPTRAQARRQRAKEALAVMSAASQAKAAGR